MNTSEASKTYAKHRSHLTGGEARCKPFNIENMRAFDVAGKEIELEIVE